MITVNLAINYGSKNEILNASKKLKKNKHKSFEKKLVYKKYAKSRYINKNRRASKIK